MILALVPWAEFALSIVILWRSGCLRSVSLGFVLALGVMILPAGLFYELGGVAYRTPSPERLMLFHVFMIVLTGAALLGSCAVVAVREGLAVPTGSRPGEPDVGQRLTMRALHLAVLPFLVCGLVYVGVFWKWLPLFDLLGGNVAQSFFTRPDQVEGGAPSFFAMSMVLFVLVPAYALAVWWDTRDGPRVRQWAAKCLLAIAFFFTAISLQKNTVLQLAGFLVLFGGRTIRRVALWAAALVIGLFGYYLLSKFYYLAGSGLGFYDSSLDAVLSFGRRLMVTQAAPFFALPNLAFHSAPYEGVAELAYKRELYSDVYGVYGGSMTTVFAVDLVLRLGTGWGLAVAATAVLGYFLVAGVIDARLQAYKSHPALVFMAFVWFYLGTYLAITDLYSSLPRILPALLLYGACAGFGAARGEAIRRQRGSHLALAN